MKNRVKRFENTINSRIIKHVAMQWKALFAKLRVKDWELKLIPAALGSNVVKSVPWPLDIGNIFL